MSKISRKFLLHRNRKCSSLLRRLRLAENLTVIGLANSLTKKALADGVNCDLGFEGLRLRLFETGAARPRREEAEFLSKCYEQKIEDIFPQGIQPARLPLTKDQRKALKQASLDYKAFIQSVNETNTMEG